MADATEGKEGSQARSWGVLRGLEQEAVPRCSKPPLPVVGVACGPE